MRAGKDRSEATGKRDCHLFDRLRWVDVETCQACPLAGLRSDAAKEVEATLLAAKPKKVKAGKGRNKASRKSVDLACVHRGEQVSTVGCATCGGGTTQIPVFACAIHEDCTLTRDAGGGTAICAKCQDRSPELIQLGG